jgi:hypothetical protein
VPSVGCSNGRESTRFLCDLSFPSNVFKTCFTVARMWNFHLKTCALLHTTNCSYPSLQQTSSHPPAYLYEFLSSSLLIVYFIHLNIHTPIHSSTQQLTQPEPQYLSAFLPASAISSWNIICVMLVSVWFIKLTSWGDSMQNHNTRYWSKAWHLSSSPQLQNQNNSIH